MLLVVVASFATLVASYDLFVRSTWVGVSLNGRRYPRRLLAGTGSSGVPDQPGARFSQPSAVTTSVSS